MKASPCFGLISGSLLAVFAIALQSRPMRAQEAATLPTGGYLGWVHLSDGDDKNVSGNSWNTRTGATASASGSGDAFNASLRDPVRLELSDYHASTGILRTNDLAPSPLGDSLNMHFPIAYDDLLAKLQTALGKENVKVNRTSEQGRDRYDFTLTFPPVKGFSDILARDQWSPLNTISTAWVDPKTGLLQKVTGGGKSVTLTYGAPEINSIYDLGVPRDAKVVSNRPTADAIAVYDRMEASLRKPIPDGILVKVETGKTFGAITLYYQHGVDWAIRNYRVNTPGADHGEGVDVPTDWQTTGADEFFHRLAIAMPSYECSGDAHVGWRKEIDPKTGEAYMSWAGQWFDEDGKMHSTEGKDPGAEKMTAWQILVLHTLNGPTSWAFPRDALSGRYSLENHFEIVTSPEHPGLLAVRTRYSWNPESDLSRGVEEGWVDPAHNDRAVLFIDTSYQDPPRRELDFKVVQEFSDYDTYPAPDGRSYPRLCKGTTYHSDNGKLAVSDERGNARTQFFPNRAIPEIPKNPATLPAAAAHDMP